MLPKSIFTAAAALAVILAAAPPAAWADTEELTMEELTQQVEAMQAQMAVLMQRLEAMQKEGEDIREETTVLTEDMEDMDDRMMVAERHAVLDKVRLSGDFRTQVHSIQGTMIDRIDGINVQKDLVNTLFYFGETGSPPMTSDLSDVDAYIRDNYDDYLYYLDNVVSFDFIQEQVGGLMQQNPELANQLLQLLASQQDSFVDGYDHDNDIVYTSRLRFRTQADVAENVVFDGRLSMYKVWGDSTGVQVFNGQPTSINWDGTTSNVPNSDILRVERAFFTWSDIAGLPMYLSIGRRPSTAGVPLNFREDELRGGTPLGSLFNYQYDGLTWGYHLSDISTFRICYGLGYESEWGNGSEYFDSNNRLDDAWFVGAVWDVWNTDRMFIQLIAATAQDITDGFDGLVVIPFDPVTGQEAPAPAVIRYTPTDNIGDINLAGMVFVRHDGPFDYFVSLNYDESDPKNVTTPFGGLFSDPFDTPDDENGYMYYVGGRYNFPNGVTKVGLEFNHGSKYWFNFALAEDDFFSPKTATRGDVWEVYLTHRIRDRFVFKLDYMYYDYDYSGSGWLLGAPKDVGDLNIHATPVYEDASKVMASFQARF
jgi:hypothetical protein